MDETTSGGVDTETDTEEASESGCPGADTEGTCTKTERGCAIGPATTCWSPELLGVFLVMALGRWRTRPAR